MPSKATTSGLHLQPRHRRVIEGLARQHLPNVDVWAYGSRVNGQSHDGSDLDLVLRAPELAEVPSLQLLGFWEALQESTLPFLVEARDWARLPKRFHGEIQRNYVVLVSTHDGWRDVTLGDCIEMNDAVYTLREQWPFINYLDTGNLTSGRVDAIQHLLAGEDKIPSRARRKVEPGDVLYSTVRPNQRHFGIMKDVPENFLASTGFAVIRGKEGCAHTNFVYWFLAQDSVVEQLQTIAEHSASAYPSIRPMDIERLRLRLPPLAKQRAIAAILDSLDDKIELNRRMAETLDEAVRALFRSWFIDFDPVGSRMGSLCREQGHPSRVFSGETLESELGLIPKGWKVSSLADCFDLKMGQSPPGWTYNEVGEGLPFFQGSKDFGLRLPTSRKFCTQPNRVAEAGDTLVSVRAPVGDVNLALERCCIGRGVASLRHKSGATSYTFHCMSSMRPTLRYYGNEGTVFGSLSGHQFGRLRVVEPCPRAIDLFESYSRPIDELIIRNWVEVRTLVIVRDMLAPRLLSGQIRVRDAEVIAEALT